MSSSRLPRLPDPDKWVSANKVERPPAQRPLIDPRFRAHCGIATPPPSTGRKRATQQGSQRVSQRATPSSSARPSSSAKKRGIVEVTPTAPQRSITSFFTPPTTGPSQKKGKGKSVVHALRNDVEAHRDWTPSAREASPFPSSLPFRAKTSPERFFENLLRTPGPDASSSSPAPMTQVPEEVLAKHRRLCGNDSQRPPVLSPWRLQAGIIEEDELLDNARNELEYKEERRKEEGAAKRKHMADHAHKVIGGQAVDRARKAKERRVLGEFKSLAHLSSSSPRADRESSPSDRTVLAPKALNMSLGRHSSAVEVPVSDRDDRWPKFKRTLPAVPRARTKVSRSPHKPSRSPSPKQLTPKKRHSPRHKVTPTKRRSPHHKVSPPKSRTPQKYADQQETLFVFPDPPPRPVFQPVQPKPKRQWQPVAMEAETLMTWSMGGGATLPAVTEMSEPASNADWDDNESIAGSVSSQSFPHLVESGSPSKTRSRKSASPTNPLLEFNRGRSASPRSPSPMINLFPYSPEAPAKQPSNDTIPSSLPDEPESPHHSPPSPSPSPRKLVRRADQEFKRAGLFSSISDVALHPPASAPKSASVSARSTPRPRSTQKKGTQSRLEAFGYLANNRTETSDFATPFSDEEDLDFGAEEPLFGTPKTDGRLGPVPEAPPHPSLRKAGVREVKRRESEAMARHRDQHRSHQPELTPASAVDGSDYEIPHMSGEWALPAPSTNATNMSSSDGMDMPRLSGSAREWWERLGDRDSL